MSTRRFDHLDLRVSNYEEARPFYESWLPAMGYTRIADYGAEWTGWRLDAPDPTEFIGITLDPEHKPNPNRIAFWADSRAEVDRIAAAIVAGGGKNIEGPEVCEEYSPGYYAIFFEDPSGNKFEVCFREQVNS